MSSHLGSRIREAQNKTHKHYAKAIVDRFIESHQSSAGELDIPLPQWVLYICAEDYQEPVIGELDLWEAICSLTEMFSKEELAKRVGISVKFDGPAEAKVTWSGV